MNIIIDGHSCVTQSKEPVLKIATDNGIYIPHFCYHEDQEVEANCRACLVEVVNPGENTDVKAGEVVTSCTLIATEGLEVNSHTTEATALRKTNIELLLRQHKFHCATCPRGTICAVMDSVVKDRVNPRLHQELTDKFPIHPMAQAAELDPNVCIACNQCVKACDDIGIGYLQLKGKGTDNRIAPTDDPNIDCIYCGQCTVHCPVAAAREQYSLTDVEAAIADPDKVVIVQMAPSVRVSIGESFGFKPGTNLEKQLTAAFKQMGFDYVFDVNMGADITTIVEADELVDRITNNGVLPMFTSCCPGWVKFIEFYYPEMLPHLTTARSPQIHSGGAYKTWWAEKTGTEPKKIVVVSIMPCTSKKYEARHEKLKIDGMYPVDYVLTARETAAMLKKNRIDLNTINPQEIDSFGEYSGAAAIYGASGGVMESALRTAVATIHGQDLDRLEFEQVRGMEGIKRATITVDGKQIKVAVVATAKNARIILDEIKKDPHIYDYIEFMACPGGCIGGGGQPIPSTKRIIKERTVGLYQIDNQSTIRSAHKNPVVQEYMKYCKNAGTERSHQLLHTHYSKKHRGE